MSSFRLLLLVLITVGCDGTPTSPPRISVEGHLSVDPSSVQLAVGGRRMLVADLRDDDGVPIAGTPVKWMSSDQSVAIVDATGHVVAVAPGIAIVSVTAGGMRATAQVIVGDGGLASVKVVPATTELQVGAQASLSTVLTTTSGKVVGGIPVFWRILDTSVASVGPDGLLTGDHPGETAVIASAEGISGSGAVKVDSGPPPPPPPPPGPWPNQPSVLTTTADQPWSQMGGLWNLLWGVAHLVNDPSAPGSPPSVLQIDFPIGFVGGAAPGTESIDFTGTREVYVGIWWMASDPWQGHPSNSNKIEYLFTPSNGSMAMIMYGHPGGPYELRVFPDWHGAWLTPNVANVPVTLGQWHQIEWLVVYGPTADPPSGIVRWWMDGVLLGDYSNVRLSSQPISEYKLAPVWGGAETVTKLENDFFRYDHVRIATH